MEYRKRKTTGLGQELHLCTMHIDEDKNTCAAVAPNNCRAHCPLVFLLAEQRLRLMPRRKVQSVTGEVIFQRRSGFQMWSNGKVCRCEK